MSPRRLSSRFGSAFAVFRMARSTMLSYLGSNRATLEPADSRTAVREMIRVAVAPQASQASRAGISPIAAKQLETARQRWQRYS